MSAGERIEHFETQRCRKDGKLIDISTTMSPILDATGKVVGISKIARDITAHKAAEKQLDLFFELSLDLLCIASSDGYLKRINPGFTQALGWSSQEILASPYIELVHPDDHAATAQEVERQVARGERVMHFENRYRHKDGSYRLLSWVSAPGPDGLMYATARDVTEARKIERELSENAYALAKSQRIAHIGSWTWDLTGPLHWSDELYAVYGVDRDTFVPNVESFINLIHPDDRGLMQDWMNTCMAGEDMGELQFRVIPPDGNIRHISGYGETTFDAEHQPAFVMGTAQNITQRKKNEEDLRQAKEQAEQASRLKASFLASMSHEIRTPLGGMLGMLELLSMSHLDKEQMATLDTAWASGRSLLRIVNDILDWSKIEEGKLDISPMPTALAPLLQDVVNTYSRVASAKSLMLWQHVDSRLVTPYAVDQLRLSQILNNFVSNAIKFTERGEIEVRAELLESREAGDLIRFSVKDSGIGIAAKDQPQLFQNYVQVANNSGRMYGGTGLGLSICRRLAEMMGGELELVSAANRGSTFSVTLTLPKSDSVVEMALPRPVEVAQRAILPLFENGLEAPLVLVVDDHPTNRELLARQVKLLGLRVKTAENGRVGVSLWRDGRFDMVITDCHMPDMDGYEMARSIRKIETSEKRGRTPIIAWTANALSEEANRIKAAGMDELLVKPVNLNELRRMLQKWFFPQEVAYTGSSEAGVTQAKPTAAVAPIDYAVLDTIMSDKDEQAKLLRDFVQHLRNDRSQLGEQLAQADRTAVQSAAHRMKGSCRMVGAGRLGDACAAIEQSAKAGDLVAAQAVMAELDAALADVERFVG